MTLLTHHALESSMLKSCAYDEESQTLEVIFHNGDTYVYRSVPVHVHQELIASESCGRYFGQNIRGQFECQQTVKTGPVKAQPVKLAPNPIAPKGELILLAERTVPAALNREVLDSFLNDITHHANGLTLRLHTMFASSLAAINLDRIKPLLALTITNAEEYAQVVQIGKIIADFRKETQAFFKPIKQQMDEPHDVACEIEKQFLNFIVPAENHLKTQATAFRVAQEKAREAEAKRIADEQRRQIEEQRLKDAEAAEAAGKTKLADALLSAPVHVKPIAESALPQAAPKVEGVTKRVNWKFRVTDINAVPRDWMMVDEKRVGEFVRTNKEKAIGVIPGIEAYSEESTSF